MQLRVSPCRYQLESADPSLPSSAVTSCKMLMIGYCIVHNVRACQFALRSWTMNATLLTDAPGLFVRSARDKPRSRLIKASQIISTQGNAPQGEHAGMYTQVHFHCCAASLPTAVKSLHVFTLTTHRNGQLIHTPSSPFGNSLPVVRTHQQHRHKSKPCTSPF